MITEKLLIEPPRKFARTRINLFVALLLTNVIVSTKNQTNNVIRHFFKTEEKEVVDLKTVR